MGTEIGYQLNGSFYLKGEGASIIGFDLPFPTIYSTRDEAEEFSGILKLSLEKANGDIVIRLYEGKNAVETLKWDEWWKYRCYKQKEECRGKENLAEEDFEPYYQRFKDIFYHYVRSENVVSYPLEYVQYWIESIEIEEPSVKVSDTPQIKKIEIKHEKTLEEEFLTFTEEEEKMKFVGLLCSEVIKIDDLSSFLSFKKEDYFKGKRFLSTKFEKEVLIYDGLKFRNVGFARFWKYDDGNYFKRVMGETGIHIGYEFKYVKFIPVQDDQEDQFYM